MRTIVFFLAPRRAGALLRHSHLTHIVRALVPGLAKQVLAVERRIMRKMDAACPGSDCPCQRADGLIIAEPSEVSVRCPRVLSVDSYSNVFSTIAAREHRLTPLAGLRVGSAPAGGSLPILAELVFARQLLLLEGRVVAVRGGGATPVPEEPEIPTSPITEKRTWVEVVLVDRNDEPIPGEPYTITLPDGTTRRGNLGADGKIRFNDIPDGMCQVSFPELDQRSA